MILAISIGLYIGFLRIFRTFKVFVSGLLFIVISDIPPRNHMFI